MEHEAKIAVFIGEFDLQLDQIGDIYAVLRKKLASFEGQNMSSETVESTGYWLHNLYCAFEDLFKIVAGFWENDVNADGEYHIHLLRRMLVRIEGVRPALLSKESYISLNEMRGFRHVFRHSYSYGLDAERIHFLLHRVMVEKRDLILKDLQIFRRAITAIK